MATHRYPALDSDALDRPDIGFVAAAGVYVATMANAAFGTGLGMMLTFFSAAGLASMTQTRYARAVVADEPAVSFRWLQPNRDLHWIDGGLGCLLLATGFVFAADQLPIRNGSVGPVFVGAWALVIGLSFRYGANPTSGTSANATSDSSVDTDNSSGPFRRPRRSVLGQNGFSGSNPTPARSQNSTSTPNESSLRGR